MTSFIRNFLCGKAPKNARAVKPAFREGHIGSEPIHLVALEAEETLCGARDFVKGPTVTLILVRVAELNDDTAYCSVCKDAFENTLHH